MIKFEHYPGVAPIEDIKEHNPRESVDVGPSFTTQGKLQQRISELNHVCGVLGIQLEKGTLTKIQEEKLNLAVAELNNLENQAKKLKEVCGLDQTMESKAFQN